MIADRLQGKNFEDHREGTNSESLSIFEGGWNQRKYKWNLVNCDAPGVSREYHAQCRLWSVGREEVWSYEQVLRHRDGYCPLGSVRGHIRLFGIKC